MNVGDAELSSMATGLAMDKPVDTFSISAESALGRSSVVTSTTAAETQFSGVNIPYCDLRGRIKGAARALYPVHIERAQYGQ